MLDHETSLNKVKKTETISTIFSDHNGMRLKLNYKKKTKNYKYMETKQWVTELGHKRNLRRH